MYSSFAIKKFFIPYQPIIMKNSKKHMESATRVSSKGSMTWVKSLGAALLLSVLSHSPTMGQASETPLPIDSTTTEIPTKTWAFMMEPVYSPTNKDFVLRMQGGWSAHGVGFGGFLDLSATDIDDGIRHAMGAWTISKSIIWATSAQIEYTLCTDWPDKIRWWIGYTYTFKDGKLIMKAYPLGDKGFEPYIFVMGQKQFGKLWLSVFAWTDITSQVSYGETEASYKLSKHIDLLGQARVLQKGYSSKPSVWAYTGVRVRF